jgi:hypothetical protein
MRLNGFAHECVPKEPTGGKYYYSKQTGFALHGSFKRSLSPSQFSIVQRLQVPGSKLKVSEKEGS